MERSFFFLFLNISLCSGMLKVFRVHLIGTEFGELKFPQRLARKNLLSVMCNCKDSKGKLQNQVTWNPLEFLDSKEIHKPKQYAYTKKLRGSITEAVHWDIWNFVQLRRLKFLITLEIESIGRNQRFTSEVLKLVIFFYQQISNYFSLSMSIILL